jgi:truncated hemoglobin YjbI
MYPAEDLAGAEERHPVIFGVSRLCGPQDYLQLRGNPAAGGCVMRQFAVNQGARDRWMLLMGNAIRGSGEFS